MAKKPMTEKQAIVYYVLMELAEKGTHPTVRSLADRLESREHRATRFSDDEVRGLLERLEADGYVEQFRDEGERVRYRPKAQEG